MQQKVQEKTTEELDQKWKYLIGNYQAAILGSEGCGHNWYIDGAFEKLKEFAKTHPEFKSRMPDRFINSTDVTGAGLYLLAKSF